MEESRICKNCRTPKPLTNEYFHSKGRGLYHEICKICRNLIGRETYKPHTDKLKIIYKLRKIKTRICSKCRTRKPLTNKFFPYCDKKAIFPYQQFGRHCKICKNEDGKNYTKNLEVRARRIQQGRDGRLKLKLEIFNAYGGAVCKCCGEKYLEFLSLDHIDNDGAEHRRKLGGGSKVYWWIKRNNFPSGFQVLCFNCNCAKQFSGGCPHKRVLDA